MILMSVGILLVDDFEKLELFSNEEPRSAARSAENH
jgi:hypothetical protein